jgi:hypothetical protein
MARVANWCLTKLASGRPLNAIDPGVDRRDIAEPLSIGTPMWYHNTAQAPVK